VATCSSSTTVSATPSTPLVIVKGVRGVAAGPLDASGDPLLDSGGQPFDDLGILKTVASSVVDCSAPNVTTGGTAEYYRYPCVPITRPGGTEEWVNTFVNGGNIPVTRLAAIDVLPRANDRGVIVTLPRSSKWTPTLSTLPTIVGGPADASLAVYYVAATGIASTRCNATDIPDRRKRTPDLQRGVGVFANGQLAFESQAVGHNFGDALKPLENLGGGLSLGHSGVRCEDGQALLQAVDFTLHGHVLEVFDCPSAHPERNQQRGKKCRNCGSKQGERCQRHGHDQRDDHAEDHVLKLADKFDREGENLAPDGDRLSANGKRYLGQIHEDGFRIGRDRKPVYLFLEAAKCGDFLEIDEHFGQRIRNSTIHQYLLETSGLKFATTLPCVKISV